MVRWLVVCCLVLCFALDVGCGDNGTGNQTDAPVTDGGTQSKKEPTTGQPDVAATEPPASRPEPTSPEPPSPEPAPDKRVSPPEIPRTPDTPTPPEPSVGPEPTPEPSAPDTPAPTGQDIRFIMMGDTGTGSAAQKAVAQAIKRKCDAEAQPGGRGACQFGLLLGDNFYDVGVSSETDPQFKTKFADMYSILPFPFYITIGNHDYGIDKIGGIGAGFHKFKFYRDYAKTNTQFVFPDKYFSFKKGNATFISLNTCELFFEGVPGVDVNAQRKFVQAEVAKAKQNGSTWVFAFGHHPYISNGTHGNAGTYEGLPLIPFVSGGSIKRFMEKEICGKVDFYFAGHDHNMQLLKQKCGTHFLVHGAGAKTKKAGDTKRNPVWFQNFNDTGFTFIHIKGRQMTIEFYTATSKQPVFSKTYTK